MDAKPKPENLNKHQVTAEEINSLLEVGRMLYSVLTLEEIEELQKLFSSKREIGNTGGS
ncbi:MAG: hypothetical protein HN547_02210 [Chloroflexi bacterium]|jgi:hypothetical protein|nr:hypothetical protein [Chloroflexota bacterium]MBT4305003.1 hypothetical protein [Chloroflexota bacterium]MBT4533234.1 hypothetical protein [Chloroflexota bacterium]MBT4683710.1 hypothetical protein [Chloroflexota bacterium]MBT6988066.1 hypothetical protein [Chloroflexota bacterium]